MVHSPTACLVFLCWALIPGTVFQFLVVRAYHCRTIEWASVHAPPLAASKRNDECAQFLRVATLAAVDVVRLVFVEITYVSYPTYQPRYSFLPTF